MDEENRAATGAIAQSDAFRRLVRERARLAWTLTAAMLAIYFGFVLLVAFAPGFLGRPVGPGWTMTLGIPIGVGVIVAGIALTGVYVSRANRRFDQLTRQVSEEAGE